MDDPFAFECGLTLESVKLGELALTQCYAQRWDSLLTFLDPTMEASLDPLAVITLLGAAQGILLALALLGLKKGGTTANRLLAAFMAVSSFAIIGSMPSSTRYILLYPHLAQVATPFHFLFGPLIFLYINISTSGRSLRRLDLLHFLPFLFCAAYYAPLYFQSRANKLRYIESMLQNYPPTELRIRAALLVIQVLPYLILAVAVFLSRSKKIKALNPALGRNQLFWLRTLVVMVLVVAAAGLFRLFFNLRAESMLLVPFCFSVLIYVAGYMALKHPYAFRWCCRRVVVDVFASALLSYYLTQIFSASVIPKHTGGFVGYREKVRLNFVELDIG